MSLYMVHRLAKAEEERIHDAMDGGTTSIEWRNVYSARSRRRSIKSLLSEELELSPYGNILLNFKLKHLT